MITDAIASLAHPTSPRGGRSATSSSKNALADFIQIQSKTLVSILDAKVDAAEARARESEAQLQQYRESVSISLIRN